MPTGKYPRKSGPKSNGWVGDAGAEQTGRTRCQKLYPGPLQCEIEGCEKKAERHHKDGDTLNNERSNIQFLCRSHHAKLEHRTLGFEHTSEARAKQSEARKRWWTNATQGAEKETVSGSPYGDSGESK